MANTGPIIIPNNLTAQLTSDLHTRHHLAVSPIWLNNFLQQTRQPFPPLPALTSTAHFRLLNSDFTTSLSTTSSSSTLLPPDIGSAAVKERRLTVGVPVQVLDVEDVGSSRWAQVEALERVERGEEVRGREVIRSVPVAVSGGEGGAETEDVRAASMALGGAGAGAGSGAAKKSSGPHRLLLQDAKGTRVSAFELHRVPRLGPGEEGMAIGIKILLKEGTLVRRGVVMLTPADVTVLGGKVQVWDQGWRDGRKERLIKSMNGENPG